MEGICGNCNGNPDDDMLTNPATTTKTSTSETTAPLKTFAMSWLADNPKLALNEDKDTCYVDDEANCLPLPPETDPCFRIYEDEVFEKCHFVVDPIMYITACQQDLCRTGPSQKGSCETIAAYARECARNGVCIDWRNKGFCTMDW
jgi:von Willebrand factor